MSADDHGSPSTYSNWDCRCKACTAANREAVDKRRKQRRAITDAGRLPASVAHNASTYANWGCRCDECTADHRRQRAHYARR